MIGRSKIVRKGVTYRTWESKFPLRDIINNFSAGSITKENK